MEDKTLHKIEAYLAGNLSDQELEVFEMELRESAELQEQLALSRRINAHFNDETILAEGMESTRAKEYIDFLESAEADALKDQIANDHKKFAVSDKKKNSKSYLLIAASIVVLLTSALFLLFQNPSSEKLYAQYYSDSDLPSVINRGEEVGSLEKGVLSFQESQFEEAIAFLKQPTNDEDKEVARRLYLGMSYVENQEYERGIQEFDLVVSANSIDATRGLWFKAITYLKMDNKSRAMEVLKMLEPGNFNFDKAQRLLEEL